MQPIEIFRAGTHTAMNGDSFAFGEAELQAAAAAYDPALHEAPIVVGHPKTDAPAYGWVGDLRFAEGTLTATPQQVDEAFAELVKAGRFKKISAAFYAPDAPTNPKPGVWYLRHVGFLGAQPPAVKGLKPVAFGDAEDGVVEFADGWTIGIVARMFRGLREFMIAQFGQDRADQVLPSYDVDSLAEQATRDQMRDLLPADPAPVMPAGFTEPEKKEPPVADADTLAAREQALAEREAALAVREAETRRTADAAFLEGLVQDGRLLPALREETAAFMAQLDDAGTVAFGEGRSLTPAAAFRELLGKLPKAVDLKPLPEGEPATFDRGDPRAIAAAANAFQEAEEKAGRPIPYAAAVGAVMKEQQQ